MSGGQAAMKLASTATKQGLQNLICANLDTVVALEQELYQEFSATERRLHRFTQTLGRLPVLFGHLIAIGAWLVVNSERSGIEPIDPWPHDGLIIFMGAEAIVLTLLVLVTQRIMQRLDNHRALLSLQIQLLNEQETTKALALLGGIQHHLGIATPDVSLEAMTEQTDPQAVSSAIQHAVEQEPPPKK